MFSQTTSREGLTSRPVQFLEKFQWNGWNKTEWEVFQMFLEVQIMRMFRANQHDPLNKVDGVK